MKNLIDRVSKHFECICAIDSEHPCITVWNAEAEEQLEAEMKEASEGLEWIRWSKGRYPDESEGEIIAVYADGTLLFNDGITSWNPLRALEFIANGGSLSK